jgi:hypothetical protein
LLLLTDSSEKSTIHLLFCAPSPKWSWTTGRTTAASGVLVATGGWRERATGGGMQAGGSGTGMEAAVVGDKTTAEGTTTITLSGAEAVKAAAATTTTGLAGATTTATAEAEGAMVVLAAAGMATVMVVAEDVLMVGDRTAEPGSWKGTRVTATRSGAGTGSLPRHGGGSRGSARKRWPRGR